MANNNGSLWNVNRGGEIIYKRLNEDTRKKYAPDSPFFHRTVPYIMLGICASIDFFVFKSKFDLVSYGNEFMKSFSIAGLLVGYDVVPIFTGIHLRRIEQGFSNARYILACLLAVTMLAVCLNIGICVATMDDLAPDESGTQSAFTTTSVNSEEDDSGVNATVVAMTMFSCILPLITSGASFCVSYLSYDPLMIKKRREDEEIREKRDEIRRFDAVILDYESDSHFAERIDAIDEGKYQEALKMQRARVVKGCDYVRQRLKEHLQDPAATTELSSETCKEILRKLDAELETLDNLDISFDKEIQTKHYDPAKVDTMIAETKSEAA